MHRLDQVVITWEPDHLVTLTVRVQTRAGRRGGTERRLEELIAAALWMEVQALDAPAPRSE